MKSTQETTMLDRFTLTIPLIVTPYANKRLESRFEVARLVYNACLNEAEKRRNKYRASNEFKQAKELKSEEDKDVKKRKVLFNKASNDANYTKYEMMNYYQEIYKSFIKEHLDAHTVMQLAKRAFYTSQRKTSGKKVKFLRYGRNFVTSVEGKTNVSPLRWKNNCVEWKGLILPALPKALVDEKNRSILEVFEEQEKQKIPTKDKIIKFTRLFRKRIKGKWKYFAQLVCVGKPITKQKLGKGIVGLDIGPSTYAWLSENKAKLDLFCKEINFSEKKIKKLQRQTTRQSRKNNPDNYETVINKKGKLSYKVKKGSKKWIVSNRQRKVYTKIAELKRKQTELRSCLHGKLVNEIREQGDVAKLEKLSYKAWQKIFGRSVGKRSPGMFVAKLKQKFNMTNGHVQEINPYKAKLSQRCPNCEKVVKKKLKERIHQCSCGFIMQRDLTSALLAVVTDEENTVHANTAKSLCVERGLLLRMACKQLQSLSTEALRGHFGLSRLELEEIIRNDVEVQGNISNEEPKNSYQTILTSG
jgi:putative transposase